MYMEILGMTTCFSKSVFVIYQGVKIWACWTAISYHKHRNVLSVHGSFSTNVVLCPRKELDSFFHFCYFVPMESRIEAHWGFLSIGTYKATIWWWLFDLLFIVLISHIVRQRLHPFIQLPSNQQSSPWSWL